MLYILSRNIFLQNIFSKVLLYDILTDTEGFSMYDNELIAAKLRRWETYLENYRLPAWEEIPDIGLYMDQVVTLVKGYLDYMPPELKEEQIITPAAINNYVRKKFMPQPVKKRYYRTHLAYLLILCALKPSLSISDIQSLIPMSAGEEELHHFYNAFRQQHKRSAEFFITRIERLKRLVVKEEFFGSAFKDPATEIVVDVALLSSFTKILSDKLFSYETDLPGIFEEDREDLPDSPDNN